MFAASTTVQVGNGARNLFWNDKWIEGCSIGQFAPDVLAAVSKRNQKCRLVADVLHAET
jgi:hypothetical protein